MLMLSAAFFPRDRRGLADGVHPYRFAEYCGENMPGLSRFMHKNTMIRPACQEKLAGKKPQGPMKGIGPCEIYFVVSYF